MAILKIARMGHPVLLRDADPVPDPTAPEIRRLVADMAETMRDAQGIGLAAPQVHVPLRLFIWRGDGDAVSVLANPEDHELILCKAYFQLLHPSVNLFYCYFLLGRREPIAFEPEWAR